MIEHEWSTTGKIHYRGQHIPVVAFYSIQGGVGKSTLARKFAELVTLAPGRDGRRPNVLMIDLDVEAQGLTFRVTQDSHRSYRTVHQIIAERNIAAVQAIDVTNTISITGGNLQNRGHLYLMPASQPEAKGIFDTIAKTDRKELYDLLLNMIQSLVAQYSISCVIIDCMPGADPATAAAATIADVPFLIGRNEDTTYKQIRLLPERFREFFPEFQPARQLVIINAVSVKDLFEQRRQQYDILNYIPIIDDVILETEGLTRPDSFRLLLFQKYIVDDIISKAFIGRDDLIPKVPEILGEEWIEILEKLARCDEAPRVKLLKSLSNMLWAGASLIVVGIGLIGFGNTSDNLPAALTSVGILVTLIGLILGIGGWYAQSQRHRILSSADKLVRNGPDEVFILLKEGASHRRLLDEMRKLALTIPEIKKQPSKSQKIYCL
ncbi:MAG: AAA family ATPase [Dehalococcoidia bacterium]|nr:AAA family ATPase [Dehalococcoidia bacterium]MDD5494745.1 AAA family ATPase [Dehalococcoidia bacterium]